MKALCAAAMLAVAAPAPAETCRLALALALERQFPLVLMDVRMPVMNGIEATKRLRSEPARRDTIVVAVTASVFPDFKAKIEEAGFDDFLGKPFRASELFAMIERHLSVKLVDRDPEATEATETEATPLQTAYTPPPADFPAVEAAAVAGAKMVRDERGVRLAREPEDAD